MQLFRAQHILLERLGNASAFKRHNALVRLTPWRVFGWIKYHNKLCSAARVEHRLQITFCRQRTVAHFDSGANTEVGPTLNHHQRNRSIAL